ncbi:MAG: sulfatase [Verrucomicrobiota bacterium]
MKSIVYTLRLISDRNVYCPIGLALFSFAVGLFQIEAATPHHKSSPNIVLIISDDQAWTDYSFMDHPQILTPNLDRLASQSLTFSRGYVPSSLCCPSLASILTGRYPHQHGITGNDPPMPLTAEKSEARKSPEYLKGREQMNTFMERVPTLPRILADRGYLSLQTGKWWQGNFRHGGFTHGMTDGEPAHGGRHGDEGLVIGRKTMQPIYDFVEMATKEQKPFFIWYAPMMPHLPHNPPERLLAKYRDKTPSLQVAKYWATVEWFDETCGELLGYLDKQGLAENTMVVYVTDNGYIQDPNGVDYAPKSKQSQYDGGLRTPLMIRWPGHVKPHKSAALASSLDLAPTLLKATGIETPSDLTGINLLDKSAVKRRDIVFGECFTHDIKDLGYPTKSLRFRWCVEGDWKLIVPNKINEPNQAVELYNLAADPFEERNLVAKEVRRVTRLQKQLDKWWAGK